MQDAQIALQDAAAPAAATAPAAAPEPRTSNLFLRNDTIFGVCEAIGQDFGFNPNWLRVTLALLLFWNPEYVIAGYLVAGAVVLASRWLFPNVQVAADEPVQPTQPANANQESLPLAA